MSRFAIIATNRAMYVKLVSSSETILWLVGLAMAVAEVIVVADMAAVTMVGGL
jgi:hypothetical protein